MRSPLVALALAAPVAYLGMDRWLDGFAHRVDLGWPVFPGAGATLLVLALATVSAQSIRAALTDPVRALRHE